MFSNKEFEYEFDFFDFGAPNQDFERYGRVKSVKDGQGVDGNGNPGSKRNDNFWRWMMKPNNFTIFTGAFLVLIGIVVLVFNYDDNPEPPKPTKSNMIFLFLPILSLVTGSMMLILGMSIGNSENLENESDQGQRW